MALITHHLDSKIILRQVDTTLDPRAQQMLAWRGHLDHFLDVTVSNAQVEQGFFGKIDRYTINQMVYSESLTAEHSFGRSIARISKDSLDFFCFYFIMEGGIGEVNGLFKPNQYASGHGRCLLALDMAQTFWTHRPACKMQAFFVPRAEVESMLPEAESLHGRIIPDHTPLTHLLFNHLNALIHEIKNMPLHEAEQAVRACLSLILSAFGKQTKRYGSSRAALRAVIFSQARRYIEQHLEDETLCAETLMYALNLPRATLYRLFEHEGGIDAYIRNRRLRAAAFELTRHPHTSITEVAYGMGFKHLADFTRAFKRAYALSPSDLRASAQQLILPNTLHHLEPMFRTANNPITPRPD